jgi:hypothetical protein
LEAGLNGFSAPFTGFSSVGVELSFSLCAFAPCRVGAWPPLVPVFGVHDKLRTWGPPAGAGGDMAGRAPPGAAGGLNPPPRGGYGPFGVFVDGE